MSIETFTADQILAIPLDAPERLFTGEAGVAKEEHRKLRKRWYPDTNPDSTPEIMARINVLYDRAVEKLAAGTWIAPGLLTVTDVRGRKYQTRYRASRPFELGEVFIGDRIVAYKIRQDFGDLVESARHVIHNFRFAGDEMRAEVLRYLPQWIDQLELADGYLVVLGKDPEHLCVRDLLAKLGGKIEPRHVAWIMSRLHNLLCYFQWAGIVHNDISLDSYFVSPAQHAGCLIGGWWYAARRHERISALPDRTMQHVRPERDSRN